MKLLRYKKLRNLYLTSSTGLTIQRDFAAILLAFVYQMTQMYERISFVCVCV